MIHYDPLSKPSIQQEAPIPMHDRLNNITHQLRQREHIDYEIKACGSGRVIIQPPFLPDNTIAKIALPNEGRFTDGVVQNAVEIWISQASTPYDDYIIPIQDSPSTHSKWVVQPRAITNIEFFVRANKRLNKLAEQGLANSDIAAINENWGIYNGKACIIDYGYFHPMDGLDFTNRLEDNIDIWAQRKINYKETKPATHP